MLNVRKIIGRVLSSNIYLLFKEGQTDGYLVDIGDSEVVFKELLDSFNVRGVFLTHTHFDHIVGINELVSQFPDCRVYTSAYGKEALSNDKKNFSFYYENSIIYKGENLRVLSDGDEVTLFDDVVFRVIETPGHCPSCLTYYTDKYIFTGDSYIPNVKVVTKLPCGNKIKAEVSLERILALSFNKIVCAGHNVDK